MNKIGFIGVGNMGSAIVKGILNSQSLNDKLEIYATDLFKEKLVDLEKKGVKVLEDAVEVVKTCKYVFLLVKPQSIKCTLEQIKDAVTEETVIVSNVAGISAEYIKSKTIPNLRVILAMPNTPLLLGEGATALALCEPTSKEEFSFICEVYSACGETAVVTQEKMVEIIAINGSSPAFIYLFAKSFIEYARLVGIDTEEAKNLFAQTLVGSAKMITNSGFSVQQLIDMVSSPGGTTLAGLDKLYEGDMYKTVQNACEACTKRGYELRKEFEAE